MSDQDMANQDPVPEEGQEKTQKEKEIADKMDNVQQRMLDAEERLSAAEQSADEAAQQIDEMKERMMRLAAEYDNHRKRSEKETKSAFNNGVGFAVHELLSIIDTLEAAAKADTTDEEYKKGVIMTLAKCEEVFKKLGVSEIEALGEPFDPEVHNAVMQQPAEGAACGTITNVIQKGYRMGDKIIRHAMVAVAP